MDRVIEYPFLLSDWNRRDIVGLPIREGSEVRISESIVVKCCVREFPMVEELLDGPEICK